MPTLCWLQCSLCCLVYIQICHVCAETLYYSVCQTFSRPDLFKALLGNVRASRLHGYHAPPSKPLPGIDTETCRGWATAAVSLQSPCLLDQVPPTAPMSHVGLAQLLRPCTDTHTHFVVVFLACLCLTWCIIIISTIFGCCYSELLQVCATPCPTLPSLCYPAHPPCTRIPLTASTRP